MIVEVVKSDNGVNDCNSYVEDNRGFDLIGKII